MAGRAAEGLFVFCADGYPATGIKGPDRRRKPACFAEKNPYPHYRVLRLLIGRRTNMRSSAGPLKGISGYR